jgi:hypothetical protein
MASSVFSANLNALDSRKYFFQRNILNLEALIQPNHRDERSF